MSITYEFATERAEEAARTAASAQLENVRERALRSEAAWRAMASQARKTAEARRAREAATAAAATAD